MDWQMVAVTLGGIVGQFLKSLQKVPTWAPQVAMLAIGMGVYVAYHAPGKDDVGFGLVRYLLEAAITGASVNGVASLAGLHPAMKTDSR